VPGGFVQIEPLKCAEFSGVVVGPVVGGFLAMTCTDSKLLVSNAPTTNLLPPTHESSGNVSKTSWSAVANYLEAL
jgi:hypothetical protein